MSEHDSKPSSTPNRRTFLKTTGALTAAALGSTVVPGIANAAPSAPAQSEPMPTRNLGKTGYKVGIFSLGGQAALEKAH